MARWLWLSVVMVVFDQVAKFAVLATMELYQTISVMPFVNFTYVHNTGAAFSFSVRRVDGSGGFLLCLLLLLVLFWLFG